MAQFAVQLVGMGKLKDPKVLTSSVWEGLFYCPTSVTNVTIQNKSVRLSVVAIKSLLISQFLNFLFWRGLITTCAPSCNSLYYNVFGQWSVPLNCARLSFSETSPAVSDLCLFQHPQLSVLAV